MTALCLCEAPISEGMILTAMAADVALLAAALIVVSLIDIGLGSSEAFSIASALRRQSGRRLARMLQILVATSVSGFIAGVLTIWVSSWSVRVIAILLAAAATLEFGIITLITLAILLSEKKEK